MTARLLILLKSVDGGTGTYLEGFLGIKKLYPIDHLEIKIMVLESPQFRTRNVYGYTFLYDKNTKHSARYSINPYRVIGYIKELWWFLGGVKEFKPDIVLASDSHSILISEITKILNNGGYKTISAIQNNLIKVIDYKIEYHLRSVIKYVLASFFQKSDLVVTVSKNLSKSIFFKFKLKKMPITIPAILPSRVITSKSVIIPAKNVIVSIARFDAQKDHKTLIDAFSIVSKKIPNAKLWLVGDGPLKRSLDNYVRKNKLSNRIKLLGWVQNPIGVLKKSSLFVLSSNWEGFPLTLLEAMAIGLPVVATDCDFGPRELIGKNKYGLLTPVGDPKRMATKMLELLTNFKKWKHYSSMSKLRSEDYNSKIMLQKFKKTIDHLMSVTVG